MGIANQLFGDDRPLAREICLSEKKSGERVWFCVETLWVVMTFMLFVFMGPFAAIAVVPAVLSLAGQQKDAPMPEAIEGNR
ncbi:MAG: hypothetical protein KKG47_15865 [Proteobacteria bacterium]|nr:hypothetical protein [Pseudomonadota bacterium]MBU1737782.1 hypothetical protein [Pseudomonadota bacterium]